MSNEEKLKDFLKFLNSNKQLLKKHKISELLDSEDLQNYSKAKFQKIFKDYLENIDNPFSCELPLEYVTGDIVIGNWGINPNVLIKLNLSEISGSIIIAGATGSGKTNVLLWILDQIQKQYET